MKTAKNLPTRRTVFTTINKFDWKKEWGTTTYEGDWLEHHETEPNQVMSLKEIQTRFTQGLAIPQISEAQYSDVDVSMYDNMNKFDKLEAAKELQYRRQILEEELAESKAKKAAEEEEQRYEAEVARRQALLNKPSDEPK